MKAIAIFAVLLAVSLAAPSTDEKIADGEKTEAVGPSSEDKGKDTPPSEEASSEADPAEVVVATSVEEEKTDETVTEEEMQKKKAEYAAICRASTGATQEQITAISQDPIDDAPTAVKCYIKCLAEHFGVEKDDVLQKDVARDLRPSTVTEDEYETIIETCADLQTDDPCDSAYLRYSCYFKASGEKIRIA